MSDEPILNEYGQLATWDDCLDYGMTPCNGQVMYDTSPVTGMRLLRCNKHSLEAIKRNDRIRQEYGLTYNYE